MNIYAIRDILIDYYMTPFAGPDDKTVLAAIARTINNEINNDDIATSPKDFEVWKLAEIHEHGHIEPEKEKICNCAQLVRAGVRTVTDNGTSQGAGQAATAAASGHEPPSRYLQATNSHKPPNADTAHPEAGPTEATRAGY
jgi:hypothetical protein